MVFDLGAELVLDLDPSAELWARCFGDLVDEF
jgi:hypothetical protein